MKPLVYRWGRFLLRGVADEKQAGDAWPAPAETVKPIGRPSSFFRKIPSDYWLVMDSRADVFCDPRSLQRLITIARDTGAGFVYSDFLTAAAGGLVPHPLNDYQPGSIRDDFDFGHFFILSAAAIRLAVNKYGALSSDPAAALYDLRLKISLDAAIIHLPECLYTVSPPKRKNNSPRKSEAHFDYVAKENLIRQKKLEKIATAHLKRTGAHIPAHTANMNRDPEASQWKASIVIPVLNRKKTIADALGSALSQKTNFAFNILVVDNHSTDGTTGLLNKFAAKYPHVHHLIPRRRDLGIGGCWNEAIQSPFCGRYVVQLDSDDLYSSPQTLQKMMDVMRKGSYAMAVGSYTLVNEKLKPIAPGLIDHREWTKKNGHNNLLRVGGMGAPRAFDTAVIRSIGFPNVSYGEDYAVALSLSREFRIGRIYESLYLCRRWTDNTDAGLSVEKQNRYHHYKDRLRTIEIQARQRMNGRTGSSGGNACERPIPETGPSFPPNAASGSNMIFAEFSGRGKITLPSLCRNLFDAQKNTWPGFAGALRDLDSVCERELTCGQYKIKLQFNPARAVSGGAAVDSASIKNRPCFLCADNRPIEQSGILFRKNYMILCNPAPIFRQHFTVASLTHLPQDIASSLEAFLQIAFDASPAYTVFYNGPACGASAPDHLHFQMIPSDSLPFLGELKDLPHVMEKDSVRYRIGKDIDRSIMVLESKNADILKKHFFHFLETLRIILSRKDEPLMNIFCTYEKDHWQLTIFLRRKHRPDSYFAEGEKRIFVSPGAIDLAGVIITARLADFESLDCRIVRSIYREVSLAEETLSKITLELL